MTHQRGVRGNHACDPLPMILWTTLFLAVLMTACKRPEDPREQEVQLNPDRVIPNPQDIVDTKALSANAIAVNTGPLADSETVSPQPTSNPATPHSSGGNTKNTNSPEALETPMPLDIAEQEGVSIDDAAATHDPPMTTDEAGTDTTQTPRIDPESDADSEETAFADQSVTQEATDLAEEETNPSEIVQPIFIGEVPITQAIEMLASQAGINLMFQPDLFVEVAVEGAEPKEQIPMVGPFIWENVTPSGALEALLENHSLQLIENKRTGISKVTKYNAATPPLITEVVQLDHRNPTNMVSLLSGFFESSSDARIKAIADPKTSRLILITTQADFEAVTNLIAKLDTPAPQVFIEGHVVETSQNPRTSKGVDWAATLASQNISFGNGVSTYSQTTTRPGLESTQTLPSGRQLTTVEPSSTVSSLETLLDPVGGLLGITANTAGGFAPNTGFLTADGLRATLSFLNTHLDAKVVATPKTVTMDNEEAKLEVTRSFPIFEFTPGSANVASGTDVTYTNLGTILSVTPRISANSNVALRVIPEVSNIDSQDRQIINGQENIANVYAIRRMETRVVVPSGHTMVMGGMINERSSKDYSKVPILGDLPGLGLLFRRETSDREKANLILFITPTIIGTHHYQPSEAEFLDRKLDRENLFSPPDSVWDSGKPHDWSEPVYLDGEKP